jgi:hypothetical protein
MLIAIILIIVLVLMWYFGYILVRRTEAYRSCRDCIGRMPRDGILVVNPFVWPYSGTACPADLYILNKDIGTGLGFGSAPLTHLNTPDHVELIN